MVMPGVLGSLLQILIFMYGKERGKKGVVLIWLVALRSIWLARNDLIFSISSSRIINIIYMI
jgi:hypothetical protein